MKERIPDLLLPDGTGETSNDRGKMEVLSSFFASVFTEERGDIPIPTVRSFQQELTEVVISEEEVARKLKKLKPGRAMGPDGLNPRVWKETASTIARPLTLIFRNSIQIGDLPNEWKHANVTAILKKGNKQLPTHYRPVSLTCIPYKILESVIRNSMVRYLEEHNFLSPHQFGFVERRSTTLQLLHTVEDWVRRLDRGEVIDVCYLDLMEAFDSVPHRRLLEKCEVMGLEVRFLSGSLPFSIIEHKV